jgi:hypothetical protein
MVETISKPAICFDRIIERGGKWVLGSESVIKIQDTGTRRDSDSPGEISVQGR